MKILLLAWKLSGGGAERVCVSWANGLANLGHDVTVFTNINFPITYQPSKKVKIVSDGRKEYNKYLWKAILWQIILAKTIIRMKPDRIIFVMHYHPKFVYYITKLFSPKTKLVMTEHNTYDNPDYVKPDKKDLYYKFDFNKRMDAVTVLTCADKMFAREKGGDNLIKNMYVLHNPLFESSKSTEPIRRGKIILAVGRVEAWFYKGFDILMQAWNKIEKDYPDWKLRIVGHGTDNDKSRLQNLLNDYNRMEFVEYTKDIQLQYRQSEIFVLSSRYEGFGLVLIEAMSQGCACIACDYKGRQAEIVTDNEDGLLCASNDVDALARKIQLLIENESLRRELQENAPSSVTRFSERNVARNLNNILTSL